MEQDVQKTWKEIYTCVYALAEFEPWDKFKERDIITVMLKDNKTRLYFSIIGHDSDHCGFAMYNGENDFLSARQYIFGKNKKNEPVPFLKNAIIGCFGDREEVSAENYILIKELGIKCRGKGSWLFFEQYETGYFPSSVEEKNLELLHEGVGNLFTAVKAAFEMNKYPDWQSDEIFARRFCEDDNLWHNEIIKMEFPQPDHPNYIISDCDMLTEFREKPSCPYTIELDWSYIPMKIRDDNGRVCIPHVVLAANGESGFLYTSTFLTPSMDNFQAILGILDEIADKYGKPSEIRICDPELEAIYSDFCQKVGIKLTMQKTLKQVNKTRKGIADFIKYQ